MSTAELVEQVKALPARERRRFVEIILALEDDLRSGRLVKTAVKWPVAFRVAVHLSERHSVTIGTRSLDILHIASAKAIRAGELLSFDVRQRSLAQLVGLVVAP